MARAPQNLCRNGFSHGEERGENPPKPSPFRVKTLSQNATFPSRASSLSSSYDLYSATEIKVPARGKALVPTDLSIAIPEETYARIASRWEMVSKHSIDVGAGVVDADYRGPVGVILFNHSNVDLNVKPGDRIAQLILQRIITPQDLHVTMISQDAALPSRGSALAAGYDLCSTIKAKVPAQGKAIIPTGLSIECSEGACLRIAPRSGLTLKNSINIGVGAIDGDSQIPVNVILFNHSDVDLDVKPGDRIAQMVIELIMVPEIVEVLEFTEKPCQNGKDREEEKPLILRIKRLSEKAILPSRASPLSKGYELFSAILQKVPARGAALISTDLSIAVPEGTCARIDPHSELVWNHSIKVGSGVIDEGYRGPVDVILFNHSDIDFEVKPGDPIAKMFIQRIMVSEPFKVHDLDSTVRSAGGFGSTGF